ncbi:GntR family transcriptional regulator [Domibacillus indicus]|uniref:GntR family transcriptional regulator n=1 Tax=Domibacillus indicus TaxID=1437523 RepID=UPI0006180CC0|nr:GntR family transcriptional regulator [Domibacillus indicus]
MKLPIRLSKESREPIYHQIEQQMKGLIAGGNLPAGTILPSIRALAKDLEISVITTRRAYQDLEQTGFIQTLQGKGTFVAEIEHSLKEQVTVSAVYEAIERGIDTGLQYDYSLKEIEELFQSIIVQKRKERLE